MTIRTRVTKVLTETYTVLLGAILRFAVAFPICLYLYASIHVALECSHDWTNFCIVVIVMAPIFLIFGPLAHNEEDPPNHYPPILLAALLVTAIWMLISYALKYRRAK
jgi:hypothetical protein